jgi:hypothetical protein
MLKNNLFYSLGYYIYISGIILLIFSRFYLSDVHNTKVSPALYDAVTQVNKAQAQKNLSYNVNCLQFTTTSLYLIITGMFSMLLVIVVKFPMTSPVNKAISIVPLFIMILVNLWCIKLLTKHQDRISNNNVGKGYGSVMLWIVITHMIYALILTSADLPFMTLMSVTVFVGTVLGTFDVVLWYWLHYFVTDG